MKTWLKNHKTGVMLNLYIQPGASKDEICGEFAERLKIKLKARPQDNEANEALIHFLAKKLGIAKSRIEILRGATSRQKDLYLDVEVELIKSLLELS